MRFVLVPVLVAVAIAIAAVIERRRRSDAPTQATWSVPTQLDRSDFERPDAPWLVAVFTSADCQTCAGVAAKARVMDCAEVAVAEVEVAEARALHARYGIDAVPTTVVADAAGVVRTSWLGPVTATDLWAGVAKVRNDPTPDICD